MKRHEDIAIAIPTVLVPRQDIDATKWAVVACDQYTSEPEYWEKVKDTVGPSPSTLNMIYPEVFLSESDPEARIKAIRDSMNAYLQEGIFREKEGLVYVEREAAGAVRKGIVICVDLEKYDYTKGSTSLIRATEGTIVERIPPRVKIRKGAPLESPHIMVLIDDPDDSVIGPLTDAKGSMEMLYDFDLMMNSGHLTGYAVDSQKLEDSVVKALQNLADPVRFTEKYGLPAGTPVLLFAMGDGNHSLATAKAIWETTKQEAEDPAAVMDSPTRYALVELVNVHDEALVFEPIHRVIFNITEGRNLLEEMQKYYGSRYSLAQVTKKDAMIAAVDAQIGSGHIIGVISPDGFGLVEIMEPDSNLPVGSLQLFLDEFITSGGAEEIDYVHGTEPVVNLGAKPGNMGFYLPAMDKNDLFKTVILDGALPRKTFSMGEAEEKRFYMECRRIG
jgi:uncharacterized protein (DUF1015 family)